MKQSILVVAALALLSGGCTSVRVGSEQTLSIGTRTVTLVGSEGFNAAALVKPDPHQPNVFIANGKIVVDQEPVRPIRELPGGGYLVSWALDSQETNTFPSNSAVVFGSGAPPVQCRLVGAANKIIACVFPKPTTVPVIWKYSISVKSAAGVVQILDPSMSMD